jgi:hypothetical protein
VTLGLEISFGLGCFLGSLLGEVCGWNRKNIERHTCPGMSNRDVGLHWELGKRDAGSGCGDSR